MATEDKGRLELMLDEFTEVHGTVLMGMHKELQTLRSDVNAQVTAKLDKVIADVQKQNNELSHHLLAAKEASSRLSNGREAALKALADLAAQQRDFHLRIDASVKEIQANQTDCDARLKATGLKAVADLDAQQRSYRLQIEASINEFRALQADYDAKLNAKVKVADSLNNVTSTLLTKTNLQIVDLRTREERLQKRTQTVAIAASVIAALSIGAWQWLLQH